MKKYELTDITMEYKGRTLHRIRALKDFRDVKAGDLGGWIEKEENLSQEGTAWVYDNACVSGEAGVYDNARVSDQACVYGNACVYDNARVSGNARVRDQACVSGNARVSGNAWVENWARVNGKAHVKGNAWINSGYDIIWISCIGSKHGTTTFFNCEDGKIHVSCGCFEGTLKEFKKRVKEMHGDNKYGREYRAAIKLAKLHIARREG